MGVFKINKANQVKLQRIHPIVLKHGQLAILGPKSNRSSVGARSHDGLNFSIVLTVKKNEMFNIHQTPSSSEAKRKFLIYSRIFDDLFQASVSLDSVKLQQIIKVSDQHESYNAVHIAAVLGMMDVLDSPMMYSKLTVREYQDFLSPLQLACMHGKVKAFKFLAYDHDILGKTYAYKDRDKNNVAHWAAKCPDKTAGANMIRILKRKLMKNQLHSLLTDVNSLGEKPVHSACANMNFPAVQELTGPDLPGLEHQILQNGEVKLEDEARPLQIIGLSWNTQAFFSALLKSGMNADVRNSEGLTPLQMAVKESNFELTTQLLYNGADPNIVSSSGTHGFVGATALHIAASVCAIQCIKSLIIFGANINSRDGYGLTARHIVASLPEGSGRDKALLCLISAGARLCRSDVKGCSEDCKAPVSEPDGDSLNGDAFIANDVTDGGRGGPPGKGRMLCLDGGGIRGLVLIQMLLFMEREFERIGGRRIPIASLFDTVAGTSTGGILALAIGYGKTVVEAQRLYFKFKNEVFAGGRPYDPENVEELFKKEFGAETKMSSLVGPRIMVMASKITTTRPNVHVFQNYPSPRNKLGPPEDMCVWEVAKLTSAAPTYFALENETFVDGGLVANNPSLDALAELTELVHEGNEDYCKMPKVLVSLGTGIPPQSQASAIDINLARPSGIMDLISQGIRALDLAKMAGRIITETNFYVVKRCESWCKSIKANYVRLNPHTSEKVSLDETNDEILVNLLFETHCYMYENRKIVQKLYYELTH